MASKSTASEPTNRTSIDSIATRPLTIGVSTRAMFDLTEEHEVFEREGVKAYAAMQRQREHEPLKPGAAFEVTRRLLNLNDLGHGRIVDVILLSRNSPDLSLRAFNAFEEHGLPITRGSFTSGRSVAPFADAWKTDLFLSNERSDVAEAISSGSAAAQLLTAPNPLAEDTPDEIRFAFDGDAVVFSAESDRIFAEKGLEAFLEHERSNAQVPMKRGPLGETFLPRLAQLRSALMRDDGRSLIRVGIVTARNAPAHERVVQTLRAWDTPADEAHFVGTHDKASILRAFRAHIFFDDQLKHVSGASSFVSSGLVPGPHDPEKLITPASV